VFTVAVILCNHKEISTFYAFLVAITGFIFIFLSHQLMVSTEFFNWGAVLLFLAK